VNFSGFDHSVIDTNLETILGVCQYTEHGENGLWKNWLPGYSKYWRYW